MLFRDYSTKKKSITVTGMVITFLLTVASVVINLTLMVNQKPPYPTMTMGCIAFFAIFAGLYWNKRFRASTSGIELIGEVKGNNAVGTDIGLPK